jgi:hypothetical protein
VGGVDAVAPVRGPEGVADAVVFLASGGSDFVTGHVPRVDGGGRHGERSVALDTVINCQLYNDVAGKPLYGLPKELTLEIHE